MQMTPNETMAYIEIQLWACERGEIDAIICAFCREVNAKGYLLCCTPLVEACVTVLSEPRLTLGREELVFQNTDQRHNAFTAMFFQPSLKTLRQ
jgi:hypothetical protein